MDPYTYGGTQAAVNLADILSKEHTLIRYKAGRFLNRYHRLAHVIQASGDNMLGEQEHLMNLISDMTCQTILDSSLPLKVKTHAVSIIRADFHQWRRDHGLPCQKKLPQRKH